MPKPVQGFLTSDGRFFHTEDAARRADAKSKLLLILSKTYDEEASLDMLSFFLANREEITEYLNAHSEDAEGTRVAETEKFDFRVHEDGSYDAFNEREQEGNSRAPRRARRISNSSES